MSVTILHDVGAAILRTDHTSYALAWSQATLVPWATPGHVEHSPLRHLHWGGLLTDDDVRSLAASPISTLGYSGTRSDPRAGTEEVPVWGRLRRDDVLLKARLADGIRSLDLALTDPERDVVADGESLTVTLRDPRAAVRVVARYEVVPAADAVVRSLVVHNDGPGTLHLERALSANFPLPTRPSLQCTSLTGSYGAETHARRQPLAPGRFTVESRHGIPGHEAYPWLAVDDGADEQGGEVWSVALAWSGSWVMTVHRHDDGMSSITAGINPFDGAVDLAGGARLELPETVAVFSRNGFGGTSDSWHDYHRLRVDPAPASPRPVLYNSWEATYFDVTHQGQLALAQAAADLGAELFVMDDGWFARRDTDTRGLGDWTADTDRFADGLRPFADEVRALGLGFGLWVEPEMVNEDSDLFRAHPDWVLGWAGRPATFVRHQRVLDFAKPQVRDWAVQRLADLVAELDLAYLKWDMNRPVTEGWSEGVDLALARGWHGQVEGVHEVLRRLRSRHPRLLIEACASGGGRADLASLALNDWAWTSDQTDPLERLEIQQGWSMVLPPRTMMAWVTDTPAGLAGRTTPLDFRFTVACDGILALGGDLAAWSPAERDLARRYVAYYRSRRETLLGGRYVRLPSPAPGETVATMHLGRDGERAVVLIARRAVRGRQAWQRLRLPGLDPQARYEVRQIFASAPSKPPHWAEDSLGAELARAAAAGEPAVLVTGVSGALLAEHGVGLAVLNLPDYSSAVLEVERLPQR